MASGAPGNVDEILAVFGGQTELRRPTARRARVGVAAREQRYLACHEQEPPQGSNLAARQVSVDRWKRPEVGNDRTNISVAEAAVVVGRHHQKLARARVDAASDGANEIGVGKARPETSLPTSKVRRDDSRYGVVHHQSASHVRGVTAVAQRDRAGQMLTPLDRADIRRHRDQLG